MVAHHDHPDALDERFVALFAELAEYSQDGAHRERVRDELVAGYLPVARSIARRFANRGEPLDDLEQVATLGLINAIDRFEAQRGVPFLAYAVPTITGEIRRHFRDRSWAMRVPRQLKDLHVSIRAVVGELAQQEGQAPRPSAIAARLGISVEQVLDGLAAGASYRSESLDRQLQDDMDGTMLDSLAAADDPELDMVADRVAIRPLLDELPPRERAILVMRFFRDMTQVQIAERLGISQMHVSRLLSQTLAALRERLGESR